jgi:hypothetical protein
MNNERIKLEEISLNVNTLEFKASFTTPTGNQLVIPINSEQATFFIGNAGKEIVPITGGKKEMLYYMFH